MAVAAEAADALWVVRERHGSRRSERQKKRRRGAVPRLDPLQRDGLSRLTRQRRPRRRQFSPRH